MARSSWPDLSIPSALERGPLRRRYRDRLPRNHLLPLIYRLAGESPREWIGQGELARDRALALVEAALLAADEPLPARRLADAAGLSAASAARRLVRKLQHLYDQDGTAFQVEELAGGFQLLTRPAYHRWLVRLRRTGHDLRLTGPARETLAIIAYRQPIMRADIEVVRGVHCGEVLRLLMEKGLVRIAGRHDSLGRPVLYGTTRKFLQVFGLKSLKDLPKVEALREEGGREKVAGTEGGAGAN
jgi:segregation and condensation protein B